MVGYNEKNKGFDCEHFVKEFFLNNDFFALSTKELSYYDLDISLKDKSFKIEVKCCNFIVDNGIYQPKRYGRFDFTNPKNRSLQRSNNVYICFVVCIGEEFEILGFMNSKSLKAKRYVNLRDIMQRRLTRKEKFLDSLRTKCE